MQLLILGRTYNYNRNTTYRGTDRMHPSYHEQLDAQHEANRAFDELMDAGGESGIIHDLSAALRITRTYRQLNPPEFFDIIEVTVGDHASETDALLLGFDVSNGYANSLLSSFSDQHSETSRMGDSIYPLLDLVSDQFKTKINRFGLFDNVVIARYFSACMSSIQSLRPGALEYGSYDAVGIWKVMVPSYDCRDNGS